VAIAFGPQKQLFSMGFALIAMESLPVFAMRMLATFGNDQEMVGLLIFVICKVQSIK